MDFYGCSLIFMDFHDFFMDFYGCSLIFMDVYGF